MIKDRDRRRKVQKARYNRLKKAGLCTSCGKNGLITETRCEECAEKQVEIQLEIEDATDKRVIRLKGSKDRIRRRLEILAFLGNKCARCSFTDPRALQIDHVNGDGFKDREEYGSQSTFYRQVRKRPSEYQLLCANCNWIKRAERQETGRKFFETEGAVLKT